MAEDLAGVTKKLAPPRHLLSGETLSHLCSNMFLLSTAKVCIISVIPKKFFPAEILFSCRASAKSIGIFDSEFIEQVFEIVLGREAGVHEIPFDARPVTESVVIEYFQLIGYDERHIT